jgi:hypothetical protein
LSVIIGRLPAVLNSIVEGFDQSAESRQRSDVLLELLLGDEKGWVKDLHQREELMALELHRGCREQQDRSLREVGRCG